MNTITTLITFLLLFLLGYITGVYLPIKFRREDKKPKISISPLQEEQLYFNITNHGGDILNLSIEIFWLYEGEQKRREMDNFYDFNENPIFGNPHKANSLKRGETKKVINCPRFSDDGNITVIIDGNDINEKQYTQKLVLKNNIWKG